MTEADKRLWTPNDFAAAHSISRRHVYDMLKRRDIEGVKVGRLTLITEESRLRWLRSLPFYTPEGWRAGAERGESYPDQSDWASCSEIVRRCRAAGRHGLANYIEAWDKPERQ